MELMLALALGLLVIAGIVTLFTSNSATYAVLNSQARLQENARFAFEFVSRSARTAGYFGCAPEPTNIVRGLRGGWAQIPEYNMTAGVQGHEGGTGGSFTPSLTSLPGGTGTNDQISANGIDTSTIADGTDNANQVRCRTYGHRLNERAPVLTGPATKAGYQWFAADEVSSIAAASLLEDAEQVLQWLSMWQHEEDEEGNPVMRSYGLPTTDVQYLRYNGNGNAPGHYRVGEFDEQGRLKVDTEAA